MGKGVEERQGDASKRGTEGMANPGEIEAIVDKHPVRPGVHECKIVLDLS
jgi:hypothetical protein